MDQNIIDVLAREFPLHGVLELSRLQGVDTKSRFFPGKPCDALLMDIDRLEFRAEEIFPTQLVHAFHILKVSLGNMECRQSPLFPIGGRDTLERKRQFDPIGGKLEREFFRRSFNFYFQ